MGETKNKKKNISSFLTKKIFPLKFIALNSAQIDFKTKLKLFIGELCTIPKLNVALFWRNCLLDKGNERKRTCRNVTTPGETLTRRGMCCV